MLRIFLLLAVAASTSQAWGNGKFNQKLTPGDSAPAWENLPGVDDKNHSLSDLAEKEVVVVIFTCNSCPYAVDYQERLKAFAKRYCGPEQRVALVAICANRIKEDQLPAMKERADREQFNFSYLYDESQQVARAYGASWTPECFVLDRERKIVYQGAFDDSSKEAEVKQHYVADAVEATLTGADVAVAETPAVGCAVRYVRERRKK